MAEAASSRVRSSRIRSSRIRQRMSLGVAIAIAAVLAAPMMASPVGASVGQVVTNGTDGLTAIDAATNLAGSGLTVSNVSYTGDPSAVGTFTGMGVVGFDSGVVLSTGNAHDVVGPNTNESQGTALETVGDAGLDALVAPNTTNDAAVLQFDFVAVSNQVSFNYVFSSDEYNEFANGSYDDVFGFFVNGVNCATVGGSRVSVNSINGGNPIGTGAVHPELFRNNAIADGAPLDTQMDGLTTVLTCSSPVTAGAVNTLRLAIADTSDSSYDSAVFLQADSFTAGLPPTCPASSVGVVPGTPSTFDLGVTDPNPADVLNYSIATPPANGTLSGTSPILTYTPNAGYTGNDSFTYTASDGINTCGPSTVTFVGGQAPRAMSLSTTQAQPGGMVDIAAGGFAPGSTVTITIESTPVVIGSAIATATGQIVAQVQIPLDFPAGPHTIRLIGTTIGGAVIEQSQAITIASLVSSPTPTPTQAPTSTQQQLPATGSHGGQLVAIAMLLILTGLAVVQVSRPGQPNRSRRGSSV